MNEEKCGECEVTGKTPTRREQMLSEDTTKLVGIYGLRNKINGKWYIGQSWNINARWHHYRRLSCERQQKLYNALVKYGYDGFDKIVLEKLISPTQEQLDVSEEGWIKEKNSVEDGYNLTSGGKSNGRHSPETILKMRGKRKSKRTKEQLKRMSDAQKGKVQTEESIEKRRQKLLGRKRPPRSDEWCRKISEQAKLRYKDKTKHPSFRKITDEAAKEKIRSSLLKNRLSKVAIIEHAKILQLEPNLPTNLFLNAIGGVNNKLGTAGESSQPMDPTQRLT